jgi:hypothetical protein
MFDFFRIDINTSFKIENFSLNNPLIIKNEDDKFLSIHEIDNKVFFDINKNDLDTQKWIIEKDETLENVFYIKCLFKRYNFTHYLGSPNMNNRVFLYTSKNRFTKWKIENMHNDIFNVCYFGEKFDKNVVSIVIARYNEYIDWALAYSDIAIVYNKGSNFEYEKNIQNVITVENVGREGHTYLFHIITNYHNLTDYTVFTQGEPFLHNETILYGIDNYYKTLDVQPLGLQYIRERNIPPNEILNKYKVTTEFGLEYLTMNINNNIEYIEPFKFNDNGINDIITRYKEKFDCSSIVEHFLNRSFIRFDKQINEIKMTYCGLFSVKKENIKMHEISFYGNLLNELISYNSQGGENGYILERLWLFLFQLVVKEGEKRVVS